MNGKYKVPCWCVKGDLIGLGDERIVRRGMRVWGGVWRSCPRCERSERSQRVRGVAEQDLMGCFLFSDLHFIYFIISEDFI